MNNIEVIAFDADDTLWANETHFQEARQRFCVMMEDFVPHLQTEEALFNTEMQDLPYYGYGLRPFIISMIETATRIAGDKLEPGMITSIINMGKEILDSPIEILDGVTGVLKELEGKYRLAVVTKGDLLDQEKKLKKSRLERYFDHIEIISDKRASNYRKLVRSMDCTPGNFLMIGNSMKSDILPVLEIGGYAVYVPFHVTWSHEQLDEKICHPRFSEIKSIKDLLPYLEKMKKAV